MLQQLVYFGYFVGWLSLYIGMDTLIARTTMSNGRYFLVHAIHNAIITYSTYNDIIYSYTDFNTILTSNVDYFPSIITVSLHIYHILYYYKQFVFDDWLHHSIMGIALYVVTHYNTGRLINYSLFFTTGLPGMIDYTLLYMVKNNKLDYIYEKTINNYINLWVRSPGCISHAVLTILTYNTYKETILYGNFLFFCYMFSAIITYWNGVYFMNKVVINYNTYKHVKIIGNKI
jgi:hypothetical protein